MAVVRFCDWTKKRVAADEEMTTLDIAGLKFEVSEEGMNQILHRLRSDVIQQELPVYPPGVRSVEPQDLLPEESDEIVEDVPELAQDAPSEDPEPFQLEIPADPRKRLGVPSRATYERVIREATVRDPETLPALSDPQKRKEAARKLAELEGKQEEAYRKTGGRDVNIGNPKNK